MGQVMLTKTNRNRDLKFYLQFLHSIVIAQLLCVCVCVCVCVKLAWQFVTEQCQGRYRELWQWMPSLWVFV